MYLEHPLYSQLRRYFIHGLGDAEQVLPQRIGDDQHVHVAVGPGRAPRKGAEEVHLGGGIQLSRYLRYPA